VGDRDLTGRRWRLVGAIWWLLIIAPALMLAEQWSTLHAASADEACCGLGPALALALVACVLALAALGRLAFAWRRTQRPQRIDALIAGVGTLPFVVLLAGMQSLLGWSNRHEVTPWSYAGAIGATVVAIALAAFGRRRFHVRLGDSLEPQSEVLEPQRKA
jgi:hypothetical protein